MPAHAPHCGRASWLLEQRLSVELLAAILFREGPPCSCAIAPDCEPIAQSNVDEDLVDEHAGA